MNQEALAALWPAAGVSARSGNLELRWIDDELLVQLATLASEGVHDPLQMPFGFPWTRGAGAEVAARLMAHQWAARANVSPSDIALEYAVLVDGVVVGAQGATGADWSALRVVETGSWLGQAFHGRGIGTRMRAVLLHLLFDGLNAAEVTSTAFEDNAASNAISLRTGYERDGTARVLRDGVPTLQHRYRLTRERWETVRESNAMMLGAPVSLQGTDALSAVIDPALGYGSP